MPEDQKWVFPTKDELDDGKAQQDREWGRNRSAEALLQPSREPTPTQTNKSAWTGPREHPEGAVLSLVLGIVSLVFCAVPMLGLGLGLGAVFTGISGGKMCDANPERYKKDMCTAGLVCGAISAIVGLFYIGTIITLFSMLLGL